MLTEAECKNAECPPEKKQARYTDSGGMYLQVSPAGSKRWFLKYRVGGKEKQLALGSYPDVSLKSARLARDAAKLQKSEGTDPVQARKLEKLKATRNTGDSHICTPDSLHPSTDGPSGPATQAAPSVWQSLYLAATQWQNSGCWC
jgi:hypothetical protein